MSATIKAQHPTNLSPLRRLVIRRPVLAFLVMAFGLAWTSILPQLLSRSGPFGVLPFALPFQPFAAIMSILGLALPAFLVSAAKDGKEGVRNGTGRSVLIVALFHSSFNSVTGSGYATRFIRELIAGPAALLICLAVLSVVAVLITLLTRGRLAYRPESTARPTLPYAGTRQDGGAA